MIFRYASKKELKGNIGQKLNYLETAIVGTEYVSNGIITGSNRPHITGLGREFYAQVTMENNLIKSVK
ncbi:MAG: hypothetical protein CL438_10060 [Acidimicrobiaceae bacterium]|nr:hypothetical protein [Acidimicrobiaceae bacterium]|tara:strand:+ start:3457 stop:3660 length:204 start_codon:yes stop_codon:yes gene_type:complete